MITDFIFSFIYPCLSNTYVLRRGLPEVPVWPPDSKRDNHCPAHPTKYSLQYLYFFSHAIPQTDQFYIVKIKQGMEEWTMNGNAWNFTLSLSLATWKIYFLNHQIFILSCWQKSKLKTIEKMHYMTNEPFITFQKREPMFDIYEMGTMWPMQTLGSFDLLHWKTCDQERR